MFKFLVDWSKREWHPREEDLALYADGELSPSKLVRLRAHLDHCWQCRVQAEKNEQIISQVVDYLNRGFAPRLPSPPNHWRGFDNKLQRAVSEPDEASFTARAIATVRRVFSPRPASLRLASGMAVVLIALLVLSRFQVVPTVSASQLLAKAVESRAQDLHRINKPVVYQKLRIRSGAYSVTRAIYRDPIDKRVAQSVADPEVQAGRNTSSKPAPMKDAAESEQRLQPLFRAARLDWNDPLSATAFSVWRNGLRQKDDQVSESGDLLTLTTTTPDGPLAALSLTVRKADYHAVAEQLVLQDQQRVEIAELAYEVLGSDQLSSLFAPPPNAVAPLLPPAPVSVPAFAAPSESQLAETELQARVALHTAGADLGEPLEIVRDSRNSVLVRGLVNAPERKQELQAALEGIPNLKVRLATVSEAVAGQELSDDSGVNRVVVVVGRPALQDKLVEQFPNADERAAFVNRALRHAELAALHAWALRRLEVRYTPKQLVLLNQSDCHTLELLIRDHIAAIRENVAADQGLMAPLMPSGSASAGDGQLLDSRDSLASKEWRTQFDQVFESVQKLQKALVPLLAGSGDAAADAEALSRDLLTSFARLQTQLPMFSQNLDGPFLVKEVLRGGLALPEIGPPETKIKHER